MGARCIPSPSSRDPQEARRTSAARSVDDYLERRKSSRSSCLKQMEEIPEPFEEFNGAALSESVLSRDWNSPEEDAAWADL